MPNQPMKVRKPAMDPWILQSDPLERKILAY